MKISNITVLVFFAVFLLSCSRNKLSESKTQQQLKNTDTDAYVIDTVAENLYVPWSIVFTDKNRILVTERNGNLRVIENGKLNDEPLYLFNDVISEGEAGLMGLTLDPDYASNRLIYLSYAYQDSGVHVKVVRFKDNGKSIAFEKTLLENIPGAGFHDGCRLKFGPDNKLYVTTGDAGDKDKAQEVDKLNGKILRINADGSIPDDNPFHSSPVWSYGNRNSQGIAWYPGTDIMYETEHGPSGFDAPGGGDEVNIIVKGKNYGWPVVHHREHNDGMEDPLLEFTPAIAPAGAMFYKSGVISEFKNNFFFCCLRGEGIMRVIVDENNPTKVISFEKMKDINFGRIRDIEEAPDGSIYFCTSNRDGRGSVREGDDKILRIKSR